MFNSRLSRAAANMLASFQDTTSSAGTGGSAIRKALDMSNSASRPTSGRAAGMTMPTASTRASSSVSRQLGNPTASTEYKRPFRVGDIFGL